MNKTKHVEVEPEARMKGGEDDEMVDVEIKPEANREPEREIENNTKRKK